MAYLLKLNANEYRDISLISKKKDEKNDRFTVIDMKKYIALLRGVNVGGKNKISMPLLKAAFIERGFFDVVTYLNTGNIIFTSEIQDAMLLQKQCQQIIKDVFHVDLAIAVISAYDLSEALLHAPNWWDNDTESKHNAIFAIAPASVESIIKEIGETKPDYEQVFHYGTIIFWSAPLKTFSRTRWSRIASTSAYNTITIRNANTTKKLLQLACK